MSNGMEIVLHLSQWKELQVQYVYCVTWYVVNTPKIDVISKYSVFMCFLFVCLRCHGWYLLQYHGTAAGTLRIASTSFLRGCKRPQKNKLIQNIEHGLCCSWHTILAQWYYILQGSLGFHATVCQDLSQPWGYHNLFQKILEGWILQLCCGDNVSHNKLTIKIQTSQ